MPRSRLLPLALVALCLAGAALAARSCRLAPDAPAPAPDAQADLIDEVSGLYQAQARELDGARGDPAACEEIATRYRALVEEAYGRHGKPPPPPVKKPGRN